MALIVYLMQMALMCFSQCQIGEGVREAIEKMHRQAVKALLQADGEGGVAVGVGVGVGEEGAEVAEQEVKGQVERKDEDSKEVKDEEKDALLLWCLSPSLPTLTPSARMVSAVAESALHPPQRAALDHARSRRRRPQQQLQRPAAFTGEEQRLLDMYTAAGASSCCCDLYQRHDEHSGRRFRRNVGARAPRPLADHTRRFIAAQLVRRMDVCAMGGDHQAANAHSAAGGRAVQQQQQQ